LGVGTAGGGFWGGTDRCRFRHKYGFLGSVRKNIGVRIGIFLFFGVSPQKHIFVLFLVTLKVCDKIFFVCV
jgi:hypothetical protein